VVLPVATKPSHVSTINRYAATLLAPDIVPFGSLHPKSRNYTDEISFMRANKIHGIKLHPEFQDFYIDDPAVFPIYESLAAAGFIVVFHMGTDPGPFTNDHSLPHRLAAVVRSFPTLTVVASHMGGHQVWDQVYSHLVGLPVYFETSTAPVNFSKEAFVRLCRAHGTDKILFGSDTPWFDQVADVRWIRESGLNDGELADIFFRNAEQLLLP
jgi:hypothetical protein